MKEPTWCDNHYKAIDYNNIIYYSESKVNEVPLSIVAWGGVGVLITCQACETVLGLDRTMTPWVTPISTHRARSFVMCVVCDGCPLFGVPKPAHGSFKGTIVS